MNPEPNLGMAAYESDEEDIIISTGDEELDIWLRNWFDWDQNFSTRAVLKAMMASNDLDMLRSVLGTRLQFGTAGLRGEMGPGFARMNDLVVIQTTQGLLDYLDKTNSHAKTQGVVIGYDGRRNSRRFAELTTATFVSQGFRVYLYSQLCPTPFVPFAVSHFKCACGVMVTASHNPKDDNGYKVYWENGAQIISPHDKRIQASIMANLEPWDESWNTKMATSVGVLDPLPTVMDEYYKALLSSMTCTETIGKEKIRFTYTPMHGVGQFYMENAFKVAGLKPFVSVEEQRDANPEFPTVRFPNPEEGKSALSLSIRTANKYNSRIILANDPDADRLAVAEKLPSGEWKIFNGNELGALLGWWSLYSHVLKNGRDDLGNCKMLASTVSSKILNTMAEAEGFGFIETLTGFKWMGNKSYELIHQERCQVLFAFEEAIGFMCGTTVLDKDGISAAIRVAELAVHLDTEGFTLYDQLHKIYDQYGYHVSNNSYYICSVPEVISSLFKEIRQFGDGPSSTYPTGLMNGKYKVVAIRDLTTGYDSEQPNKRAKLPVSRSSQMITFKFDNGLVATLRTSGTEPKIKYYTELKTPPGDKNWDAAVETLNEMVEAIVKEWLKPDRWALEPKDDEEEKNGFNDSNDKEEN